MTDIETIRINDIEYVRADSVVRLESDDDYVIVRSRDQGVMCGHLVSIDGRRVTIRESRQLWRWSGRALCLPDIARHGIRGTARMSEASPETTFLEACGVLRCTPEAARSLRTTASDSHSRGE